MNSHRPRTVDLTVIVEDSKALEMCKAELATLETRGPQVAGVEEFDQSQGIGIHPPITATSPTPRPSGIWALSSTPHLT